LPLREYQCHACGYIDERLLRTQKTVSRDPCPQCGGKCSKLISIVGGFQFRGTGFYENDYKGKK